MAWLGEARNPMEGMHMVAAKKNITVDSLTIPSQRRYIRYFDRLLKEDKPSSRPQRLQRIIVNTVPNFDTEAEGAVHAANIDKPPTE